MTQNEAKTWVCYVCGFLNIFLRESLDSVWYSAKYFANLHFTVRDSSEFFVRKWRTIDIIQPDCLAKYSTNISFLYQEVR